MFATEEELDTFIENEVATRVEKIIVMLKDDVTDIYNRSTKNRRHGKKTAYDLMTRYMDRLEDRKNSLTSKDRLYSAELDRLRRDKLIDIKALIQNHAKGRLPLKSLNGLIDTIQEYLREADRFQHNRNVRSRETYVPLANRSAEPDPEPEPMEMAADEWFWKAIKQNERVNQLNPHYYL